MYGGGICQGTGHSCGISLPHCWQLKGFPCTQETPVTESFTLTKSGKELTPRNPLKSAQSSGTWKRLQNSHPISSHINGSYKHTHKCHRHPSAHYLPPKRLSSYFYSSSFRWAFSCWDECKSFLPDPTPAQWFQQCGGNMVSASFKAHSSSSLAVRAFMCLCLKYVTFQNAWLKMRKYRS